VGELARERIVRNSETVETDLNKKRVVFSIFWPSFLMACITSGFVFSLINPDELILLDNRVHLSSRGIYTLGFFIFWLFGSIASSLTALLMLESH